MFISRGDFKCCLVYRGQKEKKVPKTAKGGGVKQAVRFLLG